MVATYNFGSAYIAIKYCLSKVNDAKLENKTDLNNRSCLIKLTGAIKFIFLELKHD